MKISNTQFHTNFYDGLKELMSKELQPTAAFKLKTIVKALQIPINNFETQRMQLIYKFAAKDEEGKLIKTVEGKDQVLIENLEGYKKELENLLKQEYTLPLQLLTLEDFDTIPISTELLFKIEPLLEDINVNS